MWIIPCHQGIVLRMLCQSVYQVIPIRQIHQLIKYPTHYSSNGFRYRKLALKELASIHGIPPHIPLWNLFPNLLPVIPVQIMDAILSPMLMAEPVTEPTSSTIVLSPVFHDKGYTQLVSIHKCLSHSWHTVATTSLSSVRSDTAAIEYGLWDRRVQLIYENVTSSHLNSLRTFMLQLFNRRLYLECTTYFKVNYPKL